jgi:hypothetical protein
VTEDPAELVENRSFMVTAVYTFLPYACIRNSPAFYYRNSGYSCDKQAAKIQLHRDIVIANAIASLPSNSR